jgi:hypothetical protein
MHVGFPVSSKGSADIASTVSERVLALRLLPQAGCSQIVGAG